MEQSTHPLGMATGQVRWRSCGAGFMASGGLLTCGTATAQEAEGISLGVTGFLNNYFGLSAIEEADPSNDFNVATTHFDGEIQFDGSGFLDNGWEVGVRFEIEIPDFAGSLDEHYFFVEGGFGQFRFGGDNTAMYQMGLGTFSAGGIGVPINSGWISDFVPEPDGFVNAFRSPAVSTAIDITNDDNTLTYFTPRIAGFQFGASFVPRASFTGSPVNGPVNRSATFDDEDDRYRNGVAFGVNYVGDVSGAEIGLSGGYAHAAASDGVEEAGGDDIQQVMVGGTLAFAGWSFDASYANELEGRLSGAVADPTSTEGDSWIVGATYSGFEPWQFSASYFSGEVEGTTSVPGEDELQASALALSYPLGPGVVVAGTILYAKWDDEENGQQDGVSFASGVAISF